MAVFDIEETFCKLSLAEKCQLLTGKNSWHTVGFAHHKIPSIRTSDGPNGVRGAKVFGAVPSACFPCGTALGSTFDVQLLFKAGEAMADQAKAKGVHTILGPTVNIQRSPLGGRGFESFSEDPLLSGLCASAVVRGMQSQGIQATIKHFVCNDQEDGRRYVDAVLTDRALREIYLMPFQIAVRDANPATFMTCYNKVNGTHVSQSVELIENILREEWKWDGLVMSDWGGVYTTNESIIAGVDLEMPGPGRWRGSLLEEGISSKELPIKYVDIAARRVLRYVNKCIEESGVPENAPEGELNTPEVSALLRKLVGDSIVLLKNDNNILPLDKDKATAVIGPNGKVTAYCGGGSAALTPYYTVSPYEGIANAVSKKPKFALGVATFRELPLLGELLTDENGNRGYTVDMFSGPSDDPSRQHLDRKHLVNSLLVFHDYIAPGNSSPCALFYLEATGYFVPEESGTYLFGLAVNGAATLYIDGKMVVDNSKNQTPGTAIYGGGTVEEIGEYDLEASKKYKVTVLYSSQSPLSKRSKPGQFDEPGALRFGVAFKRTPRQELDRAIEVAKSVEQVVLCVGLNSEWESEGFDRTYMGLPPNVDEMVEAVLKANPNSVVVIQSGTPVSLPWINSVDGVLQAWYGGNETGNGIADVLFGKVNPSGRLPLSYPKRVEDNPAFLHFRSENGQTLYNDDVYVGYRHYEIVKKDVLFPFGYGLSYSNYKITDLEADIKDGSIEVSVGVHNIGNVAGAEVVQVYVSPINPPVGRPLKELKGFAKVFVEPGSKVQANCSIPLKYATSYWNVEMDSWVSEAGNYKILVGQSSADISLAQTISVEHTTTWNGL